MDDPDFRRRRIQRWIGAPESGDLNDEATLAELERDVIGLADYLREQAPAPAVVPPRYEGPRFRTCAHETPNQGGMMEGPLGIVWHHSDGSLESNIHWICEDSAKEGKPVSYHVIIGEDGSRHQFVPLDRVAWHAGESGFRGRTGCNRFMLGVAFTGDTYKRELEQAELDSAVEFVAQYAAKFGWTLDWMTDHRTVSPGRKTDLELVQWQRLRNALRGVLS